VFPVRYELGSFIAQDGILQVYMLLLGHRRKGRHDRHNMPFIYHASKAEYLIILSLVLEYILRGHSIAGLYK
jgi:hypothetical protein